MSESLGRRKKLLVGTENLNNAPNFGPIQAPLLEKWAWYENLLTMIGDVNNDCRFDSGDLVRVFQSGKYEDGTL